MLSVLRAFPGYFKNLVFISVGVVDSGGFKGEGAIEALRTETESMLRKYVDLARGLGLPATSRFSIGTEIVSEVEALCLTTLRDFPKASFFSGQLLFRRERWFQRALHNETAYAVQKRLQWAGVPMVVMPVRVR